MISAFTIGSSIYSISEGSGRFDGFVSSITSPFVFLGHGTHLCFQRRVRNINNDQLRTEVRFVRNNGLAFQRFHSHTCSIYENVAVIHLSFQFIKICQIIKNCMAGCLCIDLLYCGYCTIPEFILAVKDCDLGIPRGGCSASDADYPRAGRTGKEEIQR